MSSGVRFAPSPTGIFHVGNFRTAWISHWWARSTGTPWVVRFEDIDAPRVLAGAQDRQLAELKRLGLVPDELLVQSPLRARHWEVFERAAREGKIYPCFCSRKDVKAALDALEGAASAPHGVPAVYSGRCRDLNEYPVTSLNGVAWRFRSARADGAEDFIVARTEPPQRKGRMPAGESFAPAYNWACAIDDFDGDYALLVRAWDLEHVIDGQRAIQRMLIGWGGGARHCSPVYHCALVVADSGARLEKRTLGVTLDELSTRGVTSEELVRRFEKSFAAPASLAIAPEAVFGEIKRELKLSELGLG